MANVSRPMGFFPLRHVNGSPWNGQVTPFLIPSSDGTAVFVGDVVKTAGSSGAAGTVVNGLDCEGMQTAIRTASGTAGQDVLGVVVGFLADPTDLSLKHRKASTNRIALVVTDLSVVYGLQEDADTTPVAAASVGLNAAFTLTAGSATTGLSGMELDSSTVATTNTLPLKVLGLLKRPDNAFNTGGSGVDKAVFEVMLNVGLLAPNVAGA